MQNLNQALGMKLPENWQTWHLLISIQINTPSQTASCVEKYVESFVWETCDHSGYYSENALSEY